MKRKKLLYTLARIHMHVPNIQTDEIFRYYENKMKNILHWSWYAWIIQHIVSLSMHTKDSSVPKQQTSNCVNAGSRALSLATRKRSVFTANIGRSQVEKYGIFQRIKYTNTLFSLSNPVWHFAYPKKPNQINCDRAKSLHFSVCIFRNKLDLLLCEIFDSVSVVVYVFECIWFFSFDEMLNFEFLSRAPNDRHAYAYCNLNGLGRPVLFQIQSSDSCYFHVYLRSPRTIHICVAFECCLPDQSQ